MNQLQKQFEECREARCVDESDIRLAQAAFYDGASAVLELLAVKNESELLPMLLAVGSEVMDFYIARKLQRDSRN